MSSLKQKLNSIFDTIKTHLDNEISFIEFKKFVNSLRCPICGSQLDGNIHPKEARLYCVSNNEEYRVKCSPNQNFPINESITIKYDQYEYVFSTSLHVWGGDLYVNRVERYDVDVQPRYKNSTRKLLLDYTGEKLNLFSKGLSEKELLKKITTYNLFS